MGDWQPQVVVIEQVKKHPKADLLEIATVLGDYPIIIKIGQYKVGDLVVYLPIDTIVPDIEEFYFLCPVNRESFEEDGIIKSRILGPKYSVGSVPKKYRRIFAKRIRDEYSQGLLTSVPEGLKLGDSVIEVLKLTRFEEEGEENLPRIKSLGANAEKSPAGWNIPYYDIESLRKYSACFQENEEIVVTEKLNGCNFSACWDGARLWIKSRNFYKRRNELDLWWDVAIRYDLETKLQKFPMMVFFGECVGQVSGFKYDAEILDGKLLTKVHFFDIYDPVASRYLSYDLFLAMIKEVGLTTTPELYRGPWIDKDKIYPLAEGKTTLGTTKCREGLVIKTTQERFESRLKHRMQLKLIGQEYNLHKK